MASPSSISLCELPLFPLPEVVLFPKRPLPLHIFEPRYRLMINTVLETDRRFGVLLWNPSSTRSVRVGCSAAITEVVRLADGRMNIMTEGKQRFRVIEFLNDKPYLVGKVEWFDDEPPDGAVELLGRQVGDLLRDVVSLSTKLSGRQVVLPDDLPEDAVNLSYWVASLFFASASERQDLLEMRSTASRLSHERVVLSSLLSELAARVAIEEAFGR
ncbi:MAG TPA: LON peptidase substrate-binding domain-containing protein [Candidatus Obscuribacterales bacterium]